MYNELKYRHKGGFLMNCLKCGTEISDQQVFCEDCLAVMAQFPVKPGTRIQLPNRPAPEVQKKAAPRRRILSPEERVVRMRKTIQWLSMSLAVAILALVLSIALLTNTLGHDNPDRDIGQNYNTVLPEERAR